MFSLINIAIITSLPLVQHRHLNSSKAHRVLSSPFLSHNSIHHIPIPFESVFRFLQHASLLKQMAMPPRAPNPIGYLPPGSPARITYQERDSNQHESLINIGVGEQDSSLVDVEC